MGLTKKNLYTNELNRLASFAKVIGHPARLAILQHLLLKKDCICGDLVQVIGLSQPSISQHLVEMKRIDLIQGTIEGTKVCYCINYTTFKEFGALFMDLFPKNDKDGSCC